MDIGEALRRYRLAKRWTLAEMGRELGISSTHAGNLESGATPMRNARIAALKPSHPDLYNQLREIRLAEVLRELGDEPAPDADDAMSELELLIRVEEDIRRARQRLEERAADDD